MSFDQKMGVMITQTVNVYTNNRLSFIVSRQKERTIIIHHTQKKASVMRDNHTPILRCFGNHENMYRTRTTQKRKRKETFQPFEVTVTNQSDSNFSKDFEKKE